MAYVAREEEEDEDMDDEGSVEVEAKVPLEPIGAVRMTFVSATGVSKRTECTFSSSVKWQS